MFAFDPSDPFHVHARERLASGKVAWLTTTGKDGTPQPNPVWYQWDGADRITIYSQPGTHKLANIARNPRVSFNLDTADEGEDVVVFTGSASVILGAPPVASDTAYLDRYRDGIARIGMTEATYSDAYFVVIEVTLEKVRGQTAPTL